MRTWSAAATVLLLLVLAGPTAVRAQQRGGGAVSSARDRAPIDLTGYWVSYVTENWRYRMVTPAKGDYQGVQLNAPAVGGGVGIGLRQWRASASGKGPEAWGPFSW